jgi:molybdenum cofactor synthesis domain-containing protein
MKKIAVQDALGQTLCHDMTAIMADGFKGVRFKRGHVIREADIPVLLDMGKEHIFVWEPEADEVHEEDAAIALTEAICGPGIVYSGPSEGKMTIAAQTDGLFCVNSWALRDINMVPDYTVACIPGNTRVEAGKKLAGARIVPLVTKRENVEKAVAIARENAPVFSIKPFRPLKTGVVITGSEVYYGRIQDAFQPILTPKLQSYGAEILGFTKCPDALEKILEAIADFRAKGAELILLTGGMSVDPDDLTPTAIRTVGGELVIQGVPMQPGNMLTIAYADGCTLVGVPGASMHSPVTSLEVFLPRIFAGDRITREEIAGYGEGGLCQNCPTCHFPNCTFGRFML